MYTLYYAPGSASLCVHWLLLELGVEFDARRVDLDAGEQRNPEYLKLNPNGRVPTLIVDGAPVYEAAALLMLLAERHPQPSFAPAVGSRERTAYLQWMLHLANTLQPAFRTWFYPDEAAGAMNAEAAKACAGTVIESVWNRLSVHLEDSGPYVGGRALSAADFLATMLMRWSRNMPKTALAWPALERHAAAMKARPAFKEVYAREGLTDWT